MKKIIAMALTLAMAVTVFAFGVSAGVPTNSFYADTSRHILYASEGKTAQDFQNHVGVPVGDPNFAFYDDSFNLLPLTTKLATSTNNFEFLKNGVWYLFNDIIVTGDINGDGMISITDLYMIDLVILNPSNYTSNELNAADVNDDGQVTVTDKVALRGRISNGRW